ncbi:MAG: transglutaminase-like putative cysteine protease [Myxococcota bacterium]|jgi:transglutaminase-like putative cysteine protease
MRNFIETVLRLFRYPIRMAASAAAALCLVWLFTDNVGRVAAVLGALGGLVLGEALGRSRLRTGVLVTVAALGGLLLVVVDWLVVDVWLLPAMIGPIAALHLSALVLFGGGALLVAGGLRAAATRAGSGLIVEAGVLAAAVAFAFSAHRDGAIARPLWLSDRAWDWGLDPVTVIMLVGAMLSIALTALLLLESRRRLPLVASAALPILAILAMMWTDPATLVTPPQVTNLSDIQDGFGGGSGDDDEGESSGGPGGEQPEGGAQDGGQQPAGPGGTQPPPSGGQQDGGQQPAGGELGEDGEPVSPQDGESDDDPAEAQVGEDGQPISGEGGEGDKPSTPQDILDGGGSGGSPTPVAVILLGDDYKPPSEGFYLRQEPMSKLQGARLVSADRADVDTDWLDHFPPTSTSLPAPPGEHRVQIQATVSLLTEHETPFGIEAPIRYTPTRNPHPTRFVRTYAFTALAQSTPYAELLGFTAGSSDWSPEVWDHYTETPDDPRYAALAQEIVDTLPDQIRDDPFAQALKIKLHIDENMKYTQAVRHDDAPDPTADFLFGDFTGYCVHSAHASVYLWRSMGLPARMGTGYLVEEADRRGSVLMVMNTAAHAWPEVYLEDIGWVVLDVAPAVTLDPPAEPVDEDMLSALADLAREEPEPDARAPIDYAAIWETLLGVLKGLLLGGAMVFLIGSYTIKLWRTVRPVFASKRAMPRVGYRAALDRLAEAGLTRESGETRERFARRIAEVVPSFVTMTDDHVAAAMSDPLRPPPPGDFRTTSRLLRRELRTGTRWWRRLLGLLNPISFFWSR